MLIDWFTVLAQIINFLILVFLLKRFLYGRIVAAMDAREQKIASRIQEADQKRAEAEQERESYHQKNEEYEAKRQEMLARARDEAEATKKEMTEAARKEIEELKTKWHNALREEKESFLQDLQKRAEKQICAVTRQALADICNSNIEQGMISLFLRQIRHLDADKLQKIKESIHKYRNEVKIYSAFEIPASTKQKLSRGIHDVIADDVTINYMISKDLICGIELKVHDYVIGWNLKDYLTTLEEEINKTLDEETGR